MFSVAFSPDGKILASTDDENQRVWLWDVESAGQQGHDPVLATLNGHVRLFGQSYSDVGDVYGVAFSPDGKLIASVGLDGTIILWGVPNG